MTEMQKLKVFITFSREISRKYRFLIFLTMVHLTEKYEKNCR